MKCNSNCLIFSYSSLVDIFQLEKLHPEYKFHIFEVTGPVIRKIHSTYVKNRNTTVNIHLLLLNYVEKEKMSSHWLPVTDISKFLARVYKGDSQNLTFSKTDACPYCLQVKQLIFS